LRREEAECATRRNPDQRFDEATIRWLFHVCDRDLTVGDRVGAEHVVVVKSMGEKSGSQDLRISAHPAVKRRVKRDAPAPAGCNFCTQSAIRECISV
jgi:hypothetical protein